jgi:hypothetical protein
MPDLGRCPSCPEVTVVLAEAMVLAPGRGLEARVTLEPPLPGDTASHITLVRIFTLGGTLHLPDSLNLNFSHNPDGTPKPARGHISVRFLNTSSREMCIQKGHRVSKGQALYIKK